MNEPTTIRLPRLMDGQLRPIARLRPARVSITETLSPLSTAVMQLCAGEAGVSVGQFVELYEPGGSAGIFRVTEVRTDCGGSGGREVRLEHGLAILGDLVLPGWNELGGADMDTGEVIRRLLSAQEKSGLPDGAPRWTLGRCDFSDRYSYSFENEDLLTALMSLTATVNEPCMWRFDQTALPWRLSLVRCPTAPMCEVRAGRNLSGARISIDRSGLCTRLYPMGYGEGADRLDIAGVNGGVKYLEADTAGTWGVTEAVWTDASITEASTLLAAGRSILDKTKEPRVSIAVDAAELRSVTGADWDSFRVGNICRIPLPEFGVTMNERIIRVERPDVYGDPCRVKLTLANEADSLTGTLTSLARRSSVAQLYSQGAASEYSIHGSENCDPNSPAVLQFYIDDDAVHVNKVMLNFAVKAFQAYSWVEAGTGGCQAGYGGTSARVSFTTGGAVDASDGSAMSVTGEDGPTVTGRADAVNGHTHALPMHTHGMAHAHRGSAELTLPGGTVEIPGHSHGMVYGVKNVGTASRVTLTVDGESVPESAYSSRFDRIDITPWLRKDEQGRIRRGAWHDVWFTPDAPARVTADIHVRTFIRSVTGEKL